MTGDAAGTGSTPSSTTLERELDALMAHLGWRPPVDEDADGFRLTTKQGPPRRVSAERVLAAIADKIEEPSDPDTPT